MSAIAKLCHAGLMGAWDSGPFGNDDAADFTAELAEVADPGVVVAVLGDALLAITANDGYIEAPEMSRGVAAAAIVAVLASATVPKPPELNESWLNALAIVPSKQLLAESAAVFRRAFEVDDNEWYELWADAGLVDDVRDRLAPYTSAVS
jgi:Domain of unknown function (DUF4259)